MSKLRQRITLHPPPSQCLPENSFTNADMDPVPFKDRTWAWYDVGGFWISEGFQIPILQMAGSLIANGLSPGMATGVVVVRNVLVMVPCALNGYAGAATGVNFPVISRASWGLHGAKLAVAIRAIVTVFCCVYRMLAAIWPSLARRIPNHLPAFSNTTSADILCFFIFWLLTLPFLAIPSSSSRPSSARMALAPFSTSPPPPKSGYSTSFLFFSAITSTIGPQATFALNMGDFCWYSKNPRYTLYAQAVMMPLCLTLTAFLGVDPLALVGHFSSRAAQFFVALLFAFATLCTNIAGNSFLCAILGVAVTPWNILHSAMNLLNFLNGYALRLGQLYQPRGAYWFARGWNLRVVGSFFLALVPNLPGLAKLVTPGIKGLPRGFKNVYTMSWVVGLVVAGVLYLGFSHVFPVSEVSEGEEIDLAREWLYSSAEGMDEERIQAKSEDAEYI
ncbi:permease for cytosine/purines, uracil, thiamine, allantoin-domain-containing protein [Aspergillus carlsbadensis]|nr:permease for cytosine/purines, uracil, thiamine, allantoin-domain-containing protein [Aspergillus carlsbadensis]